MLNKLFIHRIYAIRYVQESVNDLGEVVSVSSTPSDLSGEIPARVEFYSGDTEYNDSNQRRIHETIIYIPSQYILLPKDELYFGSKRPANAALNELIGVVRGVNPALKGTTQALDHWEITIEDP